MRAAPARLSRLPYFVHVFALLVIFTAPAAQAATGDVLSYVKHGHTPAFPLANIDEFGGAAVGLGDLDGPGPAKYAVAVGSALDDNGGAAGSDKGSVYIMFLDAAGNRLSQQKISSTTGGLTGPIDIADEFGTSVAFLGDLDGTGPSAGAIAVGAPGDDDGAGGAGAVYVLFLSSSGTVLGEQKLSRTTGGLTITLDGLDEFGGAISSLGDMDGPGRGKVALAVGTVGDDDGGTDKGAVHLLFLNSNGTVFSHKKISNLVGGFGGALDAFDDFGSSLANLQDLDGAGPSRRALAVGAIGDDDGGTDRGAVWIAFLADTGLVLSHQKISMTSGNLAAGAGVTLDLGDEFGGALDILGDMDAAAASVMTLAVCAGGDDDGGLEHGAVYLLHLTSTGTVSSGSKISDLAGNFTAPLVDLDVFGASVAFLGDLDGAGPSGVAMLVGANGDDTGGGDRGAVYILFVEGGSILDTPWDPATATACVLGAASPNPFRMSTTISLQLGARTNAQIEIHDLTGRLVRRFDASGLRSLAWDGRDDSGHALPSGTYFLRLAVDGRAMSQATRAVLIR